MAAEATVDLWVVAIIAFFSGFFGAISGEIARYFYRKYGEHHITGFDEKYIEPTIKRNKERIKKGLRHSKTVINDITKE